MSNGTAQGKPITPDSATVRRARKFLLGLGTIFILIAIYLQFDAAGAFDYTAIGFGAFGLVLIGTGIWGADRVVNATQALLTGWP